MTESRRVHGLAGLQQAFDEVRFGAARTLNLRALAADRARGGASASSAWLRQHQVQQSGEVLVITGRGNNSEGGVSPSCARRRIRVFHELRRKGVVEAFAEHTAGLVRRDARADARAARRAAAPPRADAAAAPAEPPTLAALDDETRQQLRVLAERSLDALGVRDADPFMEGEMLRLFGSLAAMVPPGPRPRAPAPQPPCDPAMSEYE